MPWWIKNFEEIKNKFEFVPINLYVEYEKWKPKMKQLVMKPECFFNVDGPQGIVLTVLGGSLCCNIRCGEEVEIHTINEILRTCIEEIHHYDESLKEEASEGTVCGLAFSGIHYMQFRVKEPIVNPYNMKTELGKFLKWDRQKNEAQGVWILRNIS